MRSQRGQLITLEGIDGAGKSTHVQPIVQWLMQRGHSVLQTREPGGTPLGEDLRQLLLHREMVPETEALLMFAARSEHVQRVIRPALECGQWVVSDRFTDASFAYQHGGRGVTCAHLDYLEQWVVAGVEPDVTFLFDLDPVTARERVHRGNSDPDRFEQQTQGFFERVRAAYLARAASNPARFCILAAGQTPAQLGQQVIQQLALRYP